jgi:hypothetical protein
MEKERFVETGRIHSLVIIDTISLCPRVIFYGN